MTVEELFVVILTPELGEAKARALAADGARILRENDEVAWFTWRRDLAHARFAASLSADE